MKKILNKLIQLSLLYKVTKCITSIYTYINDYLKLSEFIYSDTFKGLLKKYIHINLKKDWLGRLYGVINPNIDINGNYDISSTIIEIDGDRTNNMSQVQVWLYKQLELMSDLFKIHNLYNYISLDIQHVGPINSDNFLIVFDITSRKNMTYYIKKTIKQSILYILIITGIILAL